MPSGHAVMGPDPVLAAGIGVRHGRGWAVRAASFRIGPPVPGRSALGILIDDPAQSAALVDLLAGVARPAYGELRVLGHDMATIRGRAAVRRRVGVARRATPGRCRGCACAAWSSTRPGSRGRTGRTGTLLAAAILDRLALMPWAEVPLRAAPDAIARRARLAAAAVHQPELLLLDGLLDGLAPREVGGVSRRDPGPEPGQRHPARRLRRAQRWNWPATTSWCWPTAC